MGLDCGGIVKEAVEFLSANFDPAVSIVPVSRLPNAFASGNVVPSRHRTWSANCVQAHKAVQLQLPLSN
jgi:hypothetical protein